MLYPRTPVRMCRTRPNQYGSWLGWIDWDLRFQSGVNQEREVNGLEVRSVVAGRVKSFMLQDPHVI